MYPLLLIDSLAASTIVAPCSPLVAVEIAKSFSCIVVNIPNPPEMFLILLVSADRV